MSLDLLEDLIAVEDVADLAECGGLLRWLDRHGLLDASRVLACACCGLPFVRGQDVSNQRFCSLACRSRQYRADYDARYPGRRLAQQRAKDERRRAARQLEAA